MRPASLPPARWGSSPSGNEPEFEVSRLIVPPRFGCFVVVATLDPDDVSLSPLQPNIEMAASPPPAIDAPLNTCLREARRPNVCRQSFSGLMSSPFREAFGH